MQISKYFPIIGIVLFIYVIWISEPLKILQVLSKADLLYLIISALFTILIFSLRSFRWRKIINLHSFDYSFKKCIKAWIVGIALGTATPGRIGDFVKAFYLRSKEKSLGKCLSTVVVDRIIDLTTTFFFALLGVIILSYWFSQYFVSYILIILFICAFFVIIYLFSKRRFAKVFLKFIFYYFIPKKQKEKLKIGFHSFYNSVDELKSKKIKMLKLFILSVVIWLISIVQIQIIGFAIGINIDYFYLLFVMSLVVAIELIPITVSGFGTREAFLIFSLSLVNITRESIIAFSLLYFVMAYLIGSVAGFLIWIKEPVDLDFSEK